MKQHQSGPSTCSAEVAAVISGAVRVVLPPVYHGARLSGQACIAGKIPSPLYHTIAHTGKHKWPHILGDDWEFPD